MVTSESDPFQAAVAAAVGLNTIPDVLWNQCDDWVLTEAFDKASRKQEKSAVVREQARCIRESIKTARETVAALEAEGEHIPARELVRTARDVSPAAQERSEPFFVTLSAYEQDRSWAFALETAALADALYGDRLRRFREDALNGQPVSNDEAEAWLRSPLARLVRHGTVVLALKARPLTHPTTVESCTESRDTEGRIVETTVLSVAGERVSITRDPSNRVHQRKLLTFPGGDAVEFAPNSLVGELYRHGEAIARRLPWSAEEAGWYILTGQPPPIHPLRATFTRTRLGRREQRGVITIEVEPWVTEKSVVRLYQEVRRRVLPNRDDRPRSMAVWRFVESLHAAPRPTLREVWREVPAARPATTVGLREVWRRWLDAHPDLGSMTIADAFRRWNEERSDEPTRQFRNYEKFRAALLSGIEHGNTVVVPGYRKLVTPHGSGSGEAT